MSLDEKNRMLIPAEFRRAISPETDGEALLLVPRNNGKSLWLYPEKEYHRMGEKIESGLAPGQAVQNFRRLYFGVVTKVEWDKQGRVLLPEKEVRRATLGRELTLVGAGDHVEIWNRTAWDVEEARLLQEQDQIDAQMKVTTVGIA